MGGIGEAGSIGTFFGRGVTPSRVTGSDLAKGCEGSSL